MTKVAILIPTYRGVPHHIKRSLEDMVAYSESHGIDCSNVFVKDSALPHDARHALLTEALTAGPYPHYLFVDDDMLLPANGLVELLATGKELVGGIYVTRAKPCEPTAYVMAPDGQMRCITDEEARSGMVLEVEGMGAGMLLISHSTVMKVAQHWINCVWEQQLYGLSGDRLKELTLARLERWNKFKDASWCMYLPTPGGTHFGEDISFCVRARQMGVLPHVHTGVNPKHVGEYAYSLSDLNG